MRKAIYSFLLINLLLSCGSTPETHYYLMEPPIKIESSNISKYPFVLAVERFNAAPLYNDDRLVYRESKYEAKFYNYRRWITPPAQMVTEQFLDQLKLSGLFKNVVRYPYATRADYLLRGTVKAFEEWDQEKKWFGKVILDLTVENLETHEIIRSDVFVKMTPAEQKNPREVVKALSISLQDCIDEFQKSIDQELAKISRGKQ